LYENERNLGEDLYILEIFSEKKKWGDCIESSILYYNIDAMRENSENMGFG